MDASDRSNPVCFESIKWFLDLSWFPTITEEEILVVSEAAVPNNTRKASKLAWLYLQIQFYKFGDVSFILAKTDRNLFVSENMQLTTTSTQLTTNNATVIV